MPVHVKELILIGFSELSARANDKFSGLSLSLKESD
ncbi:MAG: hypothetical protein CM15mP58_11000 [Burkholderiaceae bacterium]|nr:MAG: hypothetical protein CM15mP58_11000 [Burkholderiaceae bacterium]